LSTREGGLNEDKKKRWGKRTRRYTTGDVMYR